MIDSMINLTKIALYVSLAFTNFILFYVYFYGYFKVKKNKSPIILSLALHFLCLSLFFLYVGALPFAREFGDMYFVLLNGTLIFLPFVFISTATFFYHSITEEKEIIHVKQETNLVNQKL